MDMDISIIDTTACVVSKYLKLNGMGHAFFELGILSPLKGNKEVDADALSGCIVIDLQRAIPGGGERCWLQICMQHTRLLLRRKLQ